VIGKKWIGKIVSAIGKAAGVKVADNGGKVKYASAHDLRRAFGTRWATRVMPAVLREMMRHESIETTMKYYVGLEAQSVSDVIYKAYSAASVDSSCQHNGSAVHTSVHTNPSGDNRSADEGK
jgi:integrase